MTRKSSAIHWYDRHAARLTEQYEDLDFADVHGWLLPYLPTVGSGSVLDIGAGSGRDAAWFAERGYRVVAVEPAQNLREQAQQHHPLRNIQWLDDCLPDLPGVRGLERTFEVILLSAVWMHIVPKERARAFATLIHLLAPGGLLAVTLRLGEPDAERAMYPVSIEELVGFAEAHGAAVIHTGTSRDALGRAGVSWAEVAIRRPQDSG